MIRKVSRSILERLGYEVAEAEDGAEALARCRAGMPDLILLDWNMPVMSGIEFIQHLRGLAGRALPKVVFCTTEHDVGHIRAAAAAGASEYVIKPFDYETLHTKLRNIGAV
jgi:two-component system chemotaxis response regulator CheY